jgi:Homeodomain-like domain
VAAKDIAVKRYVVRLSADEREQLNSLIHKGKRSAQVVTKARILLKADVSPAGEGWSDSRIAEALDTSIATIQRTRRQLVEEGFESVLTRKYNAKLRPAADFRWRSGSQIDRVDMRASAGRLRQMDPASARGESCRTADC